MLNKKIFLPLAALFLVSCQTASPQKTENCPLTQLDTRQAEEMCRHFAGEDAYDAERAAFLKRKMQELNCEFYF